MEEQNCTNCKYGPVGGCDLTKCCLHPRNFIPCLWEPMEDKDNAGLMGERSEVEKGLL